MATALEQAKSLTWGTYGPGAVEAHETHGTPLPPLTFKTFGDCDTDHLESILAHMDENPGRYNELVTIAVAVVLEDRGVELEMTDRRGLIRAQKAKVLNQGTEE